MWLIARRNCKQLYGMEELCVCDHVAFHFRVLFALVCSSSDLVLYVCAHNVAHFSVARELASHKSLCFETMQFLLFHGLK